MQRSLYSCVRCQRLLNEWSVRILSRETTEMKLPEALATLKQKYLPSAGKRQMNPCNAMKGVLLPCVAQGFSTEQLTSTDKLRIMSSGADETVKEKCRCTGSNHQLFFFDKPYTPTVLISMFIFPSLNIIPKAAYFNRKVYQ